MLCHWPKQKLLLQMVGHVYSLLLFIHKCLLSWDACTIFPFPIQQPSSKQPHYIFMRFGHFRCLINTVDHVIVETQDWNQPSKCNPLLIHHLVIISLVQAVPILDCLERDAVSRFVGASSFVFQGESEAQTSCKYVNGCHSRASVAEPGCRWHDCIAEFKFIPTAWQLPPDLAMLSRSQPVSNVTWRVETAYVFSGVSTVSRKDCDSGLQ